MGVTEQDAAPKGEIDSRSVYVGNVDYNVSPDQLQSHFAVSTLNIFTPTFAFAEYFLVKPQSCGTVNRVTILTDKFNNPKGFAYIEFLEPDAVQHAVLLNESELNGRKLKVCTLTGDADLYPKSKYTHH